MTTWQAVILGLIQGLTEFLPVSSSGHLVLAQNIFGITEGALTFDILVHFGTIFAVFIVFWRDIVSLLKNPFQKLSWLIIIGSIPTAIIGFKFKDYFEAFYESPLIVGIALLVTGLLLWLAESVKSGLKNFDKMSWFNAFVIGIAQGLAITPGISRSGSTIASGLLLGLSKETAARFSFLMSIPVILGANLLEVKDLLEVGIQETNIFALILGPLTAAISGFFAIKFLLKILEGGSLKVFSYYVWVIGLITITLSIV